MKYTYILPLVLLQMVLSVGSAFAVDLKADQSCTQETNYKEVIGGGGHIIYQTFKPQFENLSGISVLLDTDGLGDAILSVLSVDKKVLVSKTMAEKSGGRNEYYFDFDPIKVTPNEEYQFIVEPTKIENEGISWFYVQNSDGSCYPDGHIITGTNDNKVDMRFITYGFDTDPKGIAAGEEIPPVPGEVSEISNQKKIDSQSISNGEQPKKNIIESDVAENPNVENSPEYIKKADNQNNEVKGVTTDTDRKNSKKNINILITILLIFIGLGLYGALRFCRKRK